MGNFSNLVRTTAFRLTALYLVLCSVIAIGLVVYITKSSVSMLVEQTQRSLFAEVASLQKVYATAGPAQVARVIEKRSRAPGAFLYLLADNFGRILGGNVSYISAGVLCSEGLLVHPFTYKRYSERQENIVRRAIAVVFTLPNHMKVLIGRDIGEPERYLRIMRNGLISALAFMLLGGGLIWFLVGRRALARIDSIAKASQRLMHGDLSGRLCVDGSGDEFDRLSKNLNKMLDSIEKLNAGLREVSDNIAHDLRTPITHLRNKVEEALSKERSVSYYREVLEDVIAKSDDLIRTFNAILLISRLEVQNMKPCFTRIHLLPILEEAVEFYSPFAEEAQVVLVLEKGPDGVIEGNRELVLRALFNLIDNAIKYSKQSQTPARVSVGLQKDREYISIVVSDNGPGISQEDTERATQRFVRLEKSRTEPGFGIGLSLTKAVMTLHGGRLFLVAADPGLKAILSFPRSQTRMP